MTAVRWTRWRRLVQLATAALYLVLPFVAQPWLAGTLAALRVGPVDLVEPAGAASAALAARALPAALLLGALPVLALAVALGPVYCSWVCPYGLVAEGIDRLRGGRSGPPEPPRARVRAGVLVGLLLLSALAGAPLAAILAPPRLLTALPLEAICGRVIPWVTCGLLGVLLVLELAGPRRLVCRALCPSGAAAALLRRRFTWGPRFDPDDCRGCAGDAACARACAWGLDPRRLEPGDGCTSCMACVERCPTGALAAIRRR